MLAHYLLDSSDVGFQVVLVPNHLAAVHAGVVNFKLLKHHTPTTLFRNHQPIGDLLCKLNLLLAELFVRKALPPFLPPSVLVSLSVLSVFQLLIYLTGLLLVLIVQNLVVFDSELCDGAIKVFEH